MKKYYAYQFKVAPNVIRQCIQGHYIVLEVGSTFHVGSLMKAADKRAVDILHSIFLEGMSQSELL